jgi:aryl-alcohol dehydrogenase-like predicted oxidoreductase
MNPFSPINRREFIKRVSIALAGLGVFLKGKWISDLFSESVPSTSSVSALEIPKRVLGRTEEKVTILGLGGEGVLRTYGRNRPAHQVIEKALDLGITYYDTAPAYSGSQDYYGESLGERRKNIFLASKTHDRTRDGSLRLLENSLKRIKTDHLDLWQLHDLESMDDLDQIFDERNGAIRALEEAREQKLVRFFGITGHYDPKVLVEAMRRYSFDTALVSLNVADKHYSSFIETVLPVAQEKNVGVIGMKVLGRGNVFDAGFSLKEAISYVLSLPVSTVIIGCSSPKEVEENVVVAKAFEKFTQDRLAELEKRAIPFTGNLNFYKA